MQLRTLLLCLVVLGLIASGCTSGTQSTSGPRKKKGPNEKVKIGFSMDTLKEERWQRDKELVTKRAAEIGADLDVQVANGSDSDQIKQAENMLTQGVDVLIVAPHNGEIAASIVEAAHRQGVPVISYDRLIKNSDVSKRPANFVVVGGSPTDNNALLLHEGQMNVLKPAEASGAVHIVTDQYAKEWQASAALNIVENALTQSHNEVDAVVASNDGTARGAVQALEGQNLAGKVLVSGQDADLASLKLIVEGKQTMTIYKSIQPLAYGAVDAAVKLARGETVATTETIDNGSKKVPAILLEPVAVDRNNLLDTVVKDGYHKLEEICAGLPPEKCPKQ
jgi:D-xylose transport system substrate-binding protein